MRVWVRHARAFHALFSTPVTKQARRSLRHAMLLSGIGLSVLATQAYADGPVGAAQCDARYSPAYHGGNAFEDVGEFEMPLDGEQFGNVPLKSRATAFSCATYKANFPIEDKSDLKFAPSGHVFATVLDGHGGWQVSEYARKSLIANIEKEIDHLKLQEDPKAVAAAIQRGFLRTDRELMAQVSGAFKLGFGAVGRCGSCALLALVHGDTLSVANAGDIRAVVGKRSDKKNDKGFPIAAVAMSNDHNAMAKAEQEKLKREHPNEDNVFVCRHPDSCYVKGALQPTRALGDFALKYSEFNGPPYQQGDRSAGRHIAAPYSPPYITALPEVQTRQLDANDRFLIIGSDGLWDYLSNEEAVSIVYEQVEQGHRERAGRALVEKVLQKAAVRYDMTYAELLALPPGSHRRRRHDDTTVIVLYFE